ncbi:hypothetical protein K491DRAFT_672713 [Lophiostoma macrostomum CBS 122681]|uniref:Uncharacterized protein n=1 Tax=Lophiostoma macrostomum CBS 122681 TaxID=1314788 RepID=A0A6A6TSU3_9PLEO|nr:hypothetical protein K491DRAFT_672713 [Lophiostoma macrostomum CBS 122681]
MRVVQLQGRAVGLHAKDPSTPSRAPIRRPNPRRASQQQPAGRRLAEDAPSCSDKPSHCHSLSTLPFALFALVVCNPNACPLSLAVTACPPAAAPHCCKTTAAAAVCCERALTLFSYHRCFTIAVVVLDARIVKAAPVKRRGRGRRPCARYRPGDSSSGWRSRPAQERSDANTAATVLPFRPTDNRKSSQYRQIGSAHQHSRFGYHSSRRPILSFRPSSVQSDGIRLCQVNPDGCSRELLACGFFSFPIASSTTVVKPIPPACVRLPMAV